MNNKPQHQSQRAGSSAIRIVDGTPPAEFPSVCICFDKDLGERHPTKAFYLRVQRGPHNVEVIDLDNQQTLPGARAAARTKGFEPTHWLDIKGNSLMQF